VVSGLLAGALRFDALGSEVEAAARVEGESITAETKARQSRDHRALIVPCAGRRFLGITYALALAIGSRCRNAGIAPLILCVRRHRRKKELRRAPRAGS
jgi:hypothetical protein